MSSNSFPRVQKSTPRVPRVLGGVVARTKRAKSGLSPVCPKCHDYLPRARESSALIKRAKIAAKLYSYSLFLDLALRTDRANTISVGVSSRHDSLLRLFRVMALVAASQSGANDQLAPSDSEPTEIGPELAASPVAVKSKPYWQIASCVSEISLARGKALCPAHQHDLKRPSTGDAPPGYGSFPTCCRTRGAAARIRSSKTFQKFRLTELTRLTLRPSVDDRPHADGMIRHSPTWGT